VSGYAAALAGLSAAGAAAAAAGWAHVHGRSALMVPLLGDRARQRPEARAWLERARSSRAARGLVPVGAAALGALIAGPPGAIIGLVSGAVTPSWIRRRNAARLAAQLESQLPQAVSAMSAGLRAGLSLPQSIRFASEEVGPPLSDELGEVARSEGLGVPLSTSLRDWTRPDRSRDLRLVGGILQLHRRTGGDLPGVLDQLSETLRDRSDASRELRGYTAQARLSGAILGGLPIGFFLFLSISSRDDIAGAYRTPIGGAAIVLGLVLEGLAFLWIRRLLRGSL
jgi:tight adherence protein B